MLFGKIVSIMFVRLYDIPPLIAKNESELCGSDFGLKGEFL
jgi:hypothetical protein